MLQKIVIVENGAEAHMKKEEYVKVIVRVPREFAEFCQTEEAKEKPYDVCQVCSFIPDTCDGPRMDAMEYKRWSEWARDYMAKHGIIKAALAKKIDMPLSTLSHAISGLGYDVRTETRTKITNALIGMDRGRYPCHMAALLMAGEIVEDEDSDAKIAELQDEVNRLNAELARVIASAESKAQEVKQEAQTKIDYLKSQVDIRDKFLAEKNQLINDLTMAVINKNKE